MRVELLGRGDAWFLARAAVERTEGLIKFLSVA